MLARICYKGLDVQIPKARAFPSPTKKAIEITKEGQGIGGKSVRLKGTKKE
jgi:hypothetical protein